MESALNPSSSTSGAWRIAAARHGYAFLRLNSPDGDEMWVHASLPWLAEAAALYGTPEPEERPYCALGLGCAWGGVRDGPPYPCGGIRPCLRREEDSDSRD